MPNNLKWMIVAGARPNFMKIAPLLKEIKSYNTNHEKKGARIVPILVHTGQHYDDIMSRVFFDDLELPRPDVDLGVGSASHAVQTANIMIEFEKVCIERKPDLVIIVGDVNSTLACSLVAVKSGIKVAHIEAGLRSFDRSMPEEINRIVTDSVSDYLFTTCEDANENLKREGIPEDKIFFVGNLMVDTLLSHRDKAGKSHILEALNLMNGTGVKDYALLTLHRPSNVDERETFEGVIKAVHELSGRMPIIFAAHLRTQKQIKTFGLEKYFGLSRKGEIPKGILMIDPLGYLDFLQLMSNARIVLSDSGGIQEETTILGVPCLTIRENTERPVTINEGTNILVGTCPDSLDEYLNRILSGLCKKGSVPELWDGQAAKRIVDILIDSL